MTTSFRTLGTLSALAIVCSGCVYTKGDFETGDLAVSFSWTVERELTSEESAANCAKVEIVDRMYVTGNFDGSATQGLVTLQDSRGTWTTKDAEGTTLRSEGHELPGIDYFDPHTVNVGGAAGNTTFDFWLTGLNGKATDCNGGNGGGCGLENSHYRYFDLPDEFEILNVQCGFKYRLELTNSALEEASN